MAPNAVRHHAPPRRRGGCQAHYSGPTRRVPSLPKTHGGGASTSRATPLPQPQRTHASNGEANRDDTGFFQTNTRRGSRGGGWDRHTKVTQSRLGSSFVRAAGALRGEDWGGHRQGGDRVVAGQSANHTTWSGRAKGPAFPRRVAVARRPSMGDGMSRLTTRPTPTPPPHDEKEGAGGEGGSWGALSHSTVIVIWGGCAVSGSNTTRRHALHAVSPVLCLDGETAAAARRPATHKPQRRRRVDRAVAASWRRGHRGSPRVAAVHHTKCVSSVGGAATTTNGLKGRGA